MKLKLLSKFWNCDYKNQNWNSDSKDEIAIVILKCRPWRFKLGFQYWNVDLKIEIAILILKYRFEDWN